MKNSQGVNDNYNQQKKRTCKIVDFTVLADHRKKLKESEKKDKYIDLARQLKKTMEHEGDNYTNRDWCFWNRHQRIIKGTGGLGNKRMSGDNPNYYIIAKKLWNMMVTIIPIVIGINKIDLPLRRGW